MEEPDRILRDAEVGSLTKLSRTTRWRLTRERKFPAPVKLPPTGSAVGWRESDIKPRIRSLKGADHRVEREREAS